MPSTVSPLTTTQRRPMEQSTGVEHISPAGLWFRFGGPLITLVFVVILEGLAHTILFVPNPGVVLILPVAFATLAGGPWQGSISAALAVAYAAFYPLISSHVGPLGGVDPRVTVVQAIMTAGMVIALTLIRSRWRGIEKLGRWAWLRQAEAARQESERRFRAIFDQTLQFMGLLTPAGTVLEVNQPALDFGGLRREDVVGKPFWEAGWWQSSPEVPVRLRQAIAAAASGELVRYEEEVLGANDSVATIDFSLKPVRGANGKVILLIPEGRDITESKWAERALRVSEMKFAGIISIASDAIITVDETQHIIMFNRGAESIFGYSADEVLGELLEVLLPTRYRSLHQDHVARFGDAPEVARRMGERQEIVGLRWDGEEFPAEASISKMEVDGERLYTVVLRDITARKRLERAQAFLAAAGELLSKSLDFDTTLQTVARITVPILADVCVVYLREDGTVRAVEVAHTEPDQSHPLDLLRGKRLDARYPHPALTVVDTGEPEMIPKVGEAFLEAMGTDEAERAAYREIGLQSALFVPFVARGETRGAVGLLACQPGRRYDADDLELARELAVRAAMAIDNARLYRAARQAITTRDDVLSVVSHDLGNPLSAIRIGTSLLLKQIPAQERSGRQWENLVAIRQSAEQMERLIADLLQVKRLDAGQVKLVRRNHRPERLIQEILDLMRPLAENRNQRLEAAVQPSLPAVPVDRERALQVLSNLVGNAIKFTPPGGCIRVEAARGDGEVRFAVVDSGPGIAKEHLSRVFDRFWRVRDGGTPGVGLGLAIARAFVEAHGGRIWVESKPNEGAAFYFAIPLDSPAADPDTDAVPEDDQGNR